MSEWISIKDRLPELDQKVLIFDIFNNIEIVFLTKTFSGEIIFFYPENDAWELNQVSHWMPLPEPPK